MGGGVLKLVCTLLTLSLGCSVSGVSSLWGDVGIGDVISSNVGSCALF